MKTILILGASILQLPAIKKAKELKLRTVVADYDPKAIGFGEEGIIKEVISTNDLDAVLEIAKKHKINGIMTLASDRPVRTCAYVGEKLGLNTVSVDTSLKATDKALMRDCLNEAGVPIPKYFVVKNEEEHLKAIKNFTKKCIVKPSDNSGSRGTYLVNDTKDINDVLHAFHYGMENAINNCILVEEFMEGPEVSVECLCWQGQCHIIQITDKLTTGAPFFVEMGHSEPSMLSADIQEKIKTVASAAVEAIGIRDGAAHVEIKVTNEGPKIVELGARLGGDNITTHLVPLSTGVDMVENCIKIALNEKPDIEVKQRCGSAIRYLESNEGVIKEIRGIEEAKQMPGIKQICIVHSVGEETSGIHSSSDRVGFVIAQAGNAQEAISKCERALQKITVLTEEKQL